MKLKMLLKPRLFVLEENTSGLDMLKSKSLNEGLYLQSICVVPRENCSYRRVRLVGKGRNAIKAARLMATHDSLYDNPGSLIYPDNSEEELALNRVHMASIWNFERHNQHKGRYLPESLAHEPMENGARIVRCISGYDGQVWVDQNLVASRWWITPPSNNDWDLFIRAVQEKLGPINEFLPDVSTVPYRQDLSVLKFTRDQIANWLSARNIGAIAALFLVCSYGYIGAQYVRESLSLKRLEDAKLELNDETELILTQRSRAIANLRYIQGFNRLGRNDSVLSALEALAEVFSNSDFAIQRFDVRDGQMEARLQGKNEISVPDVVALLEESAGLANVSLTLGANDSLIINAKLALSGTR